MRFGKTSLDRLYTCHIDLQTIAQKAITVSHVDFGIAEGVRSIVRQQELFKEGKSKVDGIKKKGKHNYIPSMAFDVYAYIYGQASWNKEHLCYIGGVITSVANELYKEGKISHRIRWGGNWDGDGEIISDQNFMDLPHFELI